MLKTERLNIHKLYNTRIKNLHILKFCIYNNILSKMNKRKKNIAKRKSSFEGRWVRI